MEMFQKIQTSVAYHRKDILHTRHTIIQINYKFNNAGNYFLLEHKRIPELLSNSNEK